MKYNVSFNKNIAEGENILWSDWDVEVSSRSEAFQKLYENVRSVYPKLEGYSILRYFEDEELIQMDVSRPGEGIVCSIDGISVLEV